MNRPELTVAQILDWADQWREENGRWPESKDGDLRFAEEKWTNIDQALRKGMRGLRRGQSLPRLLAKHRGYRNPKQLPKYTIKQILFWADQYHERHGRWPGGKSGLIPDSRGETWQAVEVALSNGRRGLPGGSSLASLLARKRSALNRKALPKLSVHAIKKWIDRFRREHGYLPTSTSGPIGTNGETWLGVDQALRRGRRGFKGKSSLMKFLQCHYGVGRHLRRQEYTIKQILAWVDEYHQRNGKWPKQNSGRIAGTNETWDRVNFALTHGKRGLGGGTTLALLVSQHRGVRSRVNLTPLSESQILRWARAFKREHGHWPNRDSGPIPNSNGENWSGIRQALGKRSRGLQRKITLSQLFAKA